LGIEARDGKPTPRSLPTKEIETAQEHLAEFHPIRDLFSDLAAVSSGL